MTKGGIKFDGHYDISGAGDCWKKWGCFCECCKMLERLKSPGKQAA